MVPRRVALFCGIALCGGLFSACQSAVPVDAAKKTPIALATGTMVAPPRVSGGTARLLDETPLADPVAHAARLAKLNVQPPDTTDTAALSNFYYERGITAFELGLSARAARDQEQALSYARRAHLPEYRILARLGWAEDTGGSVGRAIKLYKEAIDAVPSNDRGWLFGLNHTLARALTRMGDLKAAQSVVRDLRNLEGESRRWRNQPEHARARWASYLVNAQADQAHARGEPRRAELLYREALSYIERDPSFGSRWEEDIYRASIGSALLSQGRLLEAEREHRDALISTLRRTGRYSTQTATRISVLAGPVYAQGRFREAEELERAALEILDRVGAPPESLLAARLRSQLGGALEAQGRFREALESFETVRVGLAREPETFEKHFGGHIGWAYALIWSGRPKEAIHFIQTELDRKRAVLGARNPATARVLGTLAVAHKQLNEPARALAEFKEASTVLFANALRPVDGVEFARENLNRWTIGIASQYIDLLGQIHQTPLEREAQIDAAAEAFRLADIARGQAVQQALTAAAARSGAGNPKLTDLVRQQQDAQQRVTALEVALTNQLAAPRELQNAEGIGELRSDLDTLRKASDALRAQISRDFPAYAQLVSPTPATIDQARAVRRTGEALISMYVGVERTLVWAVPQSGAVVFAVIPVKRSVLCSRVNALRRSLNPSAKTLGDIPAFDVRTAYTVYETLLEPVRAGWEHADTLLVVPDQCLASLPLAVLPRKSVDPGPEVGVLFSGYRAVPWLARTHAVASLPSVTSLVTLRGIRSGSPNRRPFLGFGDPYFSREQAAAAAHDSTPTVADGSGGRSSLVALRRSPPPPRDNGSSGDVLTRRTPTFDASELARLPRLPETAEEIRTIGRATGADPTRDIFLGERANEKIVKTLDLASYRVIAFATHGLMPGDLAGLTQPALALTAPEVAGIDGDGLLTMGEILALNLDADWIVLSACNTAAGEVAGSEALSGLGRAFFYAGARALLVSNWPVETTSARAVTTDVFRRQHDDPTLSRARALQRTLNAVIDTGSFIHPQTGREVFSYAHPLFWAPFTLVGDGG